LPALLESLAGEPAEEIIVVANGTPDGSMELLEDWARRDERLVPVHSPTPSQMGALQVAGERARGEVVLMLDDDVIPAPGLVEGHARHHASRAGLVVVGYMPIDLPEVRRPGQFPSDLYSRSYERACGEYERDPVSILRGLWAGNVSLRREDLLRVGMEPAGTLPPESFYHHDRDFGLRCEESGLSGIFDRRLLARHEHQTSPETFLRHARDSGHNRWTIHASHEAMIGALPADFFERDLRLPDRLLVRLSRRRHAHRATRFLLGALTKVAGWVRLFRLESHGGFLLGVIEQQRAAREAAASAPRNVEDRR
jgi:glycosyltransferase involved in cell wall biosynthesis